MLIAAAIFAAFGQGHNHHLHHAAYQSWINSDGQGCCNDRDCGEIADQYVRMTAQGVFVFIEGVGVAKGKSDWCPVLRKHYLSKGNAPNWTTAHVCITAYYGGKTPCEQFVCFQPRPLF